MALLERSPIVASGGFPHRHEPRGRSKVTGAGERAVQIDVWGTLRVRDAGRVVLPRDFPGIKPKQVLEILVAERGHTVSKSRLAELLWTEELPNNALATLETYVSIMRQTIEPGVAARRSVVVTERGGYRLDADQTVLDTEGFSRLVQSAADLQPVEALAAMNTALALIRGPVFEDEPYAAWAEEFRSTYAQKHVKVLVDAGRLSLVTGEPSAALALAEQAVALDPLAEGGYQVMMTASYALWRQEDALRAFDRCRRLFAEELGVDPMAETVALHLAILRHEDVAGLLPRSHVAVEAAAPPAPSAPAPGLLGRSAHLAQLEEAVARAMTGHFTLMHLVGGRGMGKTKLAAMLAEGSGVPVGLNRCSDLESGLPYVALSLALRPILSDGAHGETPVVTELLRRADLAEPFDQFARLRVMESLAGVVEDSAPFLLILDDAQWADPETLAALGYLRRRCPTAPVAALIVTDVESARRDAIRGLHVDLRLEVAELSADDVAGLGADVFAATGGHPLFVSDWLEARRQGRPGGCTPALRDWVLTRCWDLGPQAYRLLTVGALLDQPFTASLLGRLVGAPEDISEDLELLVAAGLLVSDDEGFMFRHGLVRDVLADTSSTARRVRLSSAAAQLADATAARFDNLQVLPVDDPRRGESIGAGRTGIRSRPFHREP